MSAVQFVFMAFSCLGPPAEFQIVMEPMARWASPGVREGAVEISAFAPDLGRLYTTSPSSMSVLAFELNTKASILNLVAQFDLSNYGQQIQSVAYHSGLQAVVVAIAPAVTTNSGTLVLLHAHDGSLLRKYPTGVLPDMVGVSENGRWIVTADEGQPSEDYQIDPVGSVTILDTTTMTAQTVDFHTIDPEVVDPQVVVSAPAGTTFAQDAEPEYVTFSSDNQFAYISLQENNAIAKIDLERGAWLWVKSMGSIDHNKPRNAIDASDRDGGINIKPRTVFGLPMPDAISSFQMGGRDYIATANEGDARAYGAFGNSSRVQDVHLDPIQFRDASDLNSEHHLGRLKILNTHGDMDGDGDFDVLYSFGSRSLSILDADGNRIADTGSLIEQKLNQYDPEHFNANNDRVSSRDSRSDDRGPEPEGVVVGGVEGIPIAFLGLERPSGIMAFDCSNPFEPVFSGYATTRNNNQSIDLSGDLGPEGLCFIKAEDSPTGEALLVVSYEVSGSICIFKVSKKNTGPPLQKQGSASP